MGCVLPKTKKQNTVRIWSRKNRGVSSLHRHHAVMPSLQLSQPIPCGSRPPINTHFKAALDELDKRSNHTKLKPWVVQTHAALEIQIRQTDWKEKYLMIYSNRLAYWAAQKNCNSLVNDGAGLKGKVRQPEIKDLKQSIKQWSTKQDAQKKNKIFLLNCVSWKKNCYEKKRSK